MVRLRTLATQAVLALATFFTQSALADSDGIVVWPRSPKRRKRLFASNPTAARRRLQRQTTSHLGALVHTRRHKRQQRDCIPLHYPRKRRQWNDMGYSYNYLRPADGHRAPGNFILPALPV